MLIGQKWKNTALLLVKEVRDLVMRKTDKKPCVLRSEKIIYKRN